MSTELAIQEPITPMQMIQIAFSEAVKQGAAAEMVTLLIDQQRWLMKHQEEETFNTSLQRIQDSLGVIVKDAPITGKGKYASSKAIDKAIVKLCRAEKMNLSFDTEDSGSPDLLRFVCDVTLGPYKKRYTLPLPVDGTGAKGGGVMNKTDATLAAVTKGKRYLKNMIFNLRLEESDYEEGDDSVGMKIPADKIGEWLAALGESTDLTPHMKLWGKIYTTANELGDKNALDILIPAYEAKKAELSGAE